MIDLSARKTEDIGTMKKNTTPKLTKKNIKLIQNILEMIEQPNMQGKCFQAWRDNWLLIANELQKGKKIEIIDNLWA